MSKIDSLSHHQLIAPRRTGLDVEAELFIQLYGPCIVLVNSKVTTIEVDQAGHIASCQLVGEQLVLEKVRTLR